MYWGSYRDSESLRYITTLWLLPHPIVFYILLFLCLRFFVPLENVSPIWRCHHCRWRAANFDLCSALKAIEQWGFFILPHLLWHGASVYNGHLWGPVTLTPIAIAEGLAVAVSRAVTTWFYNLGLSRLGFEHPTFRLRGERSSPCTTAAVFVLSSSIWNEYMYKACQRLTWEWVSTLLKDMISYMYVLSNWEI